MYHIGGLYFVGHFYFLVYFKLSSDLSDSDTSPHSSASAFRRRDQTRDNDCDTKSRNDIKKKEEKNGLYFLIVIIALD